MNKTIYIPPKRVKRIDRPLAVLAIRDWKAVTLENPGPVLFDPPMKIDITFGWTDLTRYKRACKLACRQRIESQMQGHHHHKGARDGDAWRTHIEGCCGQEPISILKGVPPNQKLNVFFHGADVDGDEVKTRDRDLTDRIDLFVDYGDIIIDRIYWLVVGRAPIFHVFGWIPGDELKKRGKAIYVPGRGDSFGINQALLYKGMPPYKNRQIKPDSES
jgi:hypothetical protein